MPHDCLVSTRNLGVILMVERYESSRLYTDLPALPSLLPYFLLTRLMVLTGMHDGNIQGYMSTINYSVFII